MAALNAIARMPDREAERLATRRKHDDNEARRRKRAAKQRIASKRKNRK